MVAGVGEVLKLTALSGILSAVALPAAVLRKAVNFTQKRNHAKFVTHNLCGTKLSLPSKFKFIGKIFTALESATNLVDNPWSVCTQRAKQAGDELANILSKRIHGRRPVSLVGCSTGAVVIWHCLRKLAEKGTQGEGIVSGKTTDFY